MKPKDTKPRNPNYELHRVLAAIAVVFIHSVGTIRTQSNDFGISGPDLHSLYLICSAIGVRSFLFISGVFLWSKSYTASYPKEFAAKRIRAILVPYLIWTGIYLIWSTALSPSTSPLTLYNPVSFLIWLIFRGGFYFVPPFLLMTLISPLIASCIRKKPLIFLVLLSAVSLTLMSLFPTDLATNDIGVISRDFLVYSIEYSVFFTFGAWYSSVNKLNIKLGLLFPLLIIGSISAILAFSIEWIVATNILSFAASFMLIFSIAQLLKKLHFNSRATIIINLLGKSSYQIYLSHALMMSFVWVALRVLGLIPKVTWVAELVLFAFTATVTVALSVFITYIPSKFNHRK